MGVADMSWFTDLFSGGVATVIDSIGRVIDNTSTSTEEKLIIKLEMEKELNRLKVKMMEQQAKYDEEITKRWQSDNEHTITRLVRPLSFVAVLAVFFAVIFMDGNIGQFQINPAYVPVIEGLLYTMVVAYFGSRGSEKIAKTIKGQ